MKSVLKVAISMVVVSGATVGFYSLIGARGASAQTEKADEPSFRFDSVDRNDAERMMNQGEKTFRFDTFGDEDYWGNTLKLHEAIEGGKLGGVGPGLSPATALAVGLKVDVDALPGQLKAALKEGKVDLNDPATTLALLRLNSGCGSDRVFQ